MKLLLFDAEYRLSLIHKDDFHFIVPMDRQDLLRKLGMHNLVDLKREIGSTVPFVFVISKFKQHHHLLQEAIQGSLSQDSRCLSLREAKVENIVLAMSNNVADIRSL